MILRHGLPLWLDQRPPTRTFPALGGEHDVDVVIVGGGVTGAICAYLFADAGVRVAVVESRRVARGSTAASTALLMQEPDRDFHDLAARYGARAAGDIWRVLGRATRHLSRTIARLRIDAGLCRCDSVYFTLDPDKVPALRREFDRRKAAGLGGRWLSADALYRKTGIRAQAAIATSGNALVNPVRACHGFLAAAVRRGARVYERSPVRRVKASRGRVEVQTASGAVTADRVIVATGYATPEFRGLVGRFRMKDTYVIATRRLPLRLRRGRIRSRTMAWDTDRPYHYLRWTDDGRLLVGGEDTTHHRQKGSRGRVDRAQSRLLAYLGRVYPELAEEAPDYAWEGLFAETPDGLPYIGEHARYPGHLFALGYGGNGMTASYLAAELLLGLYQARDNRRKPPAAAKLFAFRRGRR